MKLMNTAVVAASFLVTAVVLGSVISKSPEPLPKCCEACADGKEKFYSVDTKHDRCGECCMKPKLYWLYHLFESGLTKAEDENPCHELGYTEYETTEKHGFLFITSTLDKYKKPN